MEPSAEIPTRLPLPPLAGVLELAQFLSLRPSELEWFADPKQLLWRRVPSPLRHYRYRVIEKSSGRLRLIEAPKPRLKQIQLEMLRRILDPIPPHPAAHGFRRGRSIQTFVADHVSQSVVLRLDLADFFPSIGFGRIAALFETFGYPRDVASLLSGLATTATPLDIWPRPDPHRIEALRHSRHLYSAPHLPQGAPTSPALANLCAYRLDCRLSALAATAGARYTRYADDLAFSGGPGFDRRVDRFHLHAAAIIEEEGFRIQHRKTRIMRPAARQHLAGLIVNQHPNIDRRDYDRLKATLNNCLRHGPTSQNRDLHPNFRAHLSGRIGFVRNIAPGRANKLQALFSQIVWDE